MQKTKSWTSFRIDNSSHAVASLISPSTDDKYSTLIDFYRCSDGYVYFLFFKLKKMSRLYFCGENVEHSFNAKYSSAVSRQSVDRKRRSFINQNNAESQTCEWHTDKEDRLAVKKILFIEAWAITLLEYGISLQRWITNKTLFFIFGFQQMVLVVQEDSDCWFTTNYRCLPSLTICCIIIFD